MATYRLCDQTVTAMLEEVRHKYHRPLEDAGVRIICIFAHAKRDEKTGEPTGPALKHHGWPAAALVRINSQKNRVQGMGDATIEIDGDTWEDRTDAEKRAIIDHEMEHIELATDEDGGIVTDDCHRPKLKMRQHDWQTGGFQSILDRHKSASLEAQQGFDFTKRLHQAELSWEGNGHAPVVIAADGEIIEPESKPARKNGKPQVMHRPMPK